mgnify:FL=1|jgi:hypothetical protein|tara:strand:+ start:86 stop:613 length:528 start_codon:yes stop_codon:yes gene_type:complete
MNSCLIIAAPRSGSTNLMRSIAKANNLSKLFEPYGPKINKELKVDGYCTKVISRRKTIEFWEEISKKFDKVVLLARKDIERSAESITKLYCAPVHDPDMKWTELEDWEKVYLPRGIEIINEAVFIIEELSNRLNIPIDYYEQVYSNYTLNDKSIKLDTSFLNPSRVCKVEKLNAI